MARQQRLGEGAGCGVKVKAGSPGEACWAEVMARGRTGSRRDAGLSAAHPPLAISRRGREFCFFASLGFLYFFPVAER